MINKLSLPSSNCDVCGSDYDLMGPIWLGEIHNKEFVEKALATLKDKEKNKL